MSEYIPVGPVQDHVKTLLGEGFTRRQISEASGVGHTTVIDVVKGRWGVVRSDVAECLLSVTPELLMFRTRFVPVGDLPGLLRAMRANGWSAKEISRRTGVSMRTVCRILKGEYERMTADHHKALMGFVRSHGGRCGPRRSDAWTS